MKIFNIKNNNADEVEGIPFKSEKEIQNLVESNIDKIFDLQFIKSELPVGKYRIDTLCFGEENNSFVIVEYKKGNNNSVIDQGYAYLQLLLNNKSDFVLVLSQYLNKIMKVEDIDWSQSRIVFISQSFTQYQKDSVNFKDVPFELWEIQKYSNNTVVFNQHRSNSDESITTLSSPSKKSMIATVSKEVNVATIKQHVSKTSRKVIDRWNALCEKLTVMGDIEIVPKSKYISLTYKDKNICFFVFLSASVRIEINRGKINPDGSKSKNYFNIDDPKKLSTEESYEWTLGKKGSTYRIRFDEKTDVDYVIFLINQKYKQFS